MVKGIKEQIKDRVAGLLIKLLGFEGIIWITATAGLFTRAIPAQDWVILSIAVAGIKTYQKTKGVATDIDTAKSDIKL